METVLSICIGLGLSAACGFRLFVPPLVMSLAARGGYLELTDGFAWLGSTPALIAFSVATALEIGAYYVPWLDNLLDTIASPAAVVAGILATASVVTGMDPFLKWSLALIAGGSVAGTVQVLTSGARGLSTLTTAGLGNPLLATSEAGGAVGLALLAVFAPVLAFLAVVVVLGWTISRARKRSPVAALNGPVEQR